MVLLSLGATLLEVQPIHAQVKPTLVPLEPYWSDDREDNFTTATAAGRDSAIDAGYGFVRVEGYVFTEPQPGTVPLESYWSNDREDNFTTATAAGRNSAIDAGYGFVRVEGYIYPSTYKPKLLEVLSIYCFETEDSDPFGEDEAYLLIDGEKVWSGDMDDGDTVYPRGTIGFRPFATDITLTLKEEDDWPDRDDTLGTYLISVSEADGAERFVRFDGDDALYLINYRVLP